MSNKTLAKNSIYNVAYNLLNVFFPLVSATYISRILQADGIGKVTFAQNIVQYFVIIAAMGIPTYGTREIAKVKGDLRDTNKLFSELFFINLFSTLLCLIAYFGMIFSFPIFVEEKSLFVALGLSILLNAINVDWFFRGAEEYGYIVFRSFLVKLASLVMMFILVRTVDDYVKFALISVIATAGNNILNVIKLSSKNIKLGYKNLNILIHLKPVFILLSTSIAINLYTLFDTTMLGIMCPSENVGYYSNSMKLVKIVITVVAAIGSVLLPRLSFHFSKGNFEECNKIVNKATQVMLFLFLPCGVGLILIADNLIPFLFGNSFIPAITTLKITALLIYVLGFSNLFGIQVLLTFGAEKKLFLCTLIGAFSNIGLNIILIPLYKQNGAAWASVVSEALVTGFSFVFAAKYVKLNFSKRTFFEMLFSLLVMCVAIILIKMQDLSNSLFLISSITIGAISYITVNAIFKNPILSEFNNILQLKKRFSLLGKK